MPLLCKGGSLVAVLDGGVCKLACDVELCDCLCNDWPPDQGSCTRCPTVGDPGRYLYLDWEVRCRSGALQTSGTWTLTPDRADLCCWSYNGSLPASYTFSIYDCIKVTFCCADVASSGSWNITATFYQCSNPLNAFIWPIQPTWCKQVHTVNTADPLNVTLDAAVGSPHCGAATSNIPLCGGQIDLIFKTLRE